MLSRLAYDAPKQSKVSLLERGCVRCCYGLWSARPAVNSSRGQLDMRSTRHTLWLSNNIDIKLKAKLVK